MKVGVQRHDNGATTAGPFENLLVGRLGPSKIPDMFSLDSAPAKNGNHGPG